MTWVVMPYLGNLEQTEAAVIDVLNQSIPVQLLLINQGGPRLTRVDDPRVFHWHHDPPLPSLSATWNRALQMVWETGGTHAWVVNNDARFPVVTLERLLEVQDRTQGWFVTACNVRDVYQHDQAVTLQDLFLYDTDPPIITATPASKGGPDFSCFLITHQCHRWFQFDEGFIPAYHEDNDYHRRLSLAGLGDKIFSVPIPYLHYGSGTLKANPTLEAEWGPKFDACRDYYLQKWGGMPHQETYQRPFGDGEMGEDLRHYMLGQGKPPWVEGVLWEEVVGP